LEIENKLFYLYGLKQQEMSYNEILRNNQRVIKERTQPVFSDIMGETNEKGRLAEFIRETELNINTDLEEPSIHDIKFKGQITNLLTELKYQTQSNSRWFTLIGLLERKIIQLRLYRNIYVSFSTQLQKSGSNRFNYILLRAPFMDLYTGKQEIRIYYKKLEDFPGFDSIDELKEVPEFRCAAIETVRLEMEKWIDSEGITLDYIREELNKIHQESAAAKNKKIVELSKLASQLKEENKKLKINK
jgi:hypothetical protein